MTTATYTFDDNTFSDLHKDALGFRPKGAFYEWLQTASNDEKQAEWDSLFDALERRMNYEAEMQREAIVKFEKLITTTIESGAKDRVTAIRWMMDAQNGCNDDVGYFEYLMGIPYGYIKKHP